MSALVFVTSEGAQHDTATREAWFVVPGAGGLELDEAGMRIRTVTPVSPLGRSLLGLCRGDEGKVRMPRGERRFEGRLARSRSRTNFTVVESIFHPVNH